MVLEHPIKYFLKCFIISFFNFKVDFQKDLLKKPGFYFLLVEIQFIIYRGYYEIYLFDWGFLSIFKLKYYKYG